MRRIVLAKFRGDRLDPDDLVQEVLLTIHRRNSLHSAFDPAKSGFVHYVHIVAANVLGHMTEAPRYRQEAGDDDAPEVTDQSPLDVLALAEDAGIDVSASRELGELVPRAPRQVWEFALEQRKAEQAQPGYGLVVESVRAVQRTGTVSRYRRRDKSPATLPCLRAA